MTHIKRKQAWHRLLFILIALSLSGIGYVISRDFALTPAESFEMAQKAEHEGAFQKAERYYLRAAQGENADTAKIASYYLGKLYRTGGVSFPVNGRKAEIFLEQAALQNLPLAQYELALMYDVGDKIPENREKAVKWMNLAAQSGLPEALYSLGVWVERGYLGKPDMNKVLALYEQAAQSGHRQAMTSLVAIYGGGFQNVPEDQEKSLFWFYQLNKNNPLLNNEENDHQKTEKEKK